MPHMDEGYHHCYIDDGGSLIYSTSPAATPRSEAMGVPAKGGSPWTNQTNGSSSALKSSKTRQQQRRQMPKQSFLDASSNNDSVGDDQDAHDDDMHFLRNSATLVSAAFNDMTHPDSSSVGTGPRAVNGRVYESTSFIPPSGQKALPSMTDDGEDESAFDADKSPTPKPSRLAWSRKQTMSDASDMSVPAQPKGVTSSRQREMSEAPVIGERPKKKGIAQFSSNAPSVADSVDEGPSQNVPESVQNEAGMSSHPASHPKKILAHRQQHDLRSNAKVKLSALDLEKREEGDKENDDPFDHANIPPSRGLSPGISMRKPKPAPKKKAAAKSSKGPLPKHKPSPRDKKPTTASQKVSTQKKQSVRPKQKAKPSAAKPVQSSVEPVRGKDNGETRHSPNNPTRSPAKEAQAEANRTYAAASSLTQNDKASGKHHADPQEDTISISSASGSEESDTDEVDDDEYVDKSRVITNYGNNEPPRTRNTKATYKVLDDSASTTDLRGDVQVKEGDANDERELDEDDVAATVLPDKFTRNAVIQTSDQNDEVLVSHQIKQKVADTQVLQPHPNNTNLDHGQRSPARDHSGPDETKTESSAADVIEQPFKQARITQPTESTSNNLGLNQNQSTQSKERMKEKKTLVDPSSMDFHSDSSKGVGDSKPKNTKANNISFGADGSRTNEKPRLEATAAVHQSGEAGPEVSSTKPSKATKAEQKNAGSIERANNSGASRHKTAGPSKTPVASFLQTQQPLPLVNDQRPDATHAHESHVMQLHTRKVAKEHQPVAKKDGNYMDSRLTRATNGEEPVPRQVVTEGKVSAGDHNDASDMADFGFADGSVDKLDGPINPDSLEQPENIDNTASVSPLEDRVIGSQVVGQELQGGVSKRKRPLDHDCTVQTLMSDNEQPVVHSPIDGSTHSSSHQSERQIIQSLQPQQSSPEQQSAKIRKFAKELGPVMKKKPVWKGHSIMSQQNVSAVKPPTAEGKDINQIGREPKGPHHPEATRSKQHTHTILTQPGAGKRPAKLQLRNLSTNVDRPSKKAKLDMLGPSAASLIADINPHFCVPANSFSSDDVFAPNENKERRDINDGIMNRLRAIESEQNSLGPEMETQRPIDSSGDKWHEPPHQRPSERLAPNLIHTHFVQNAAHGQRLGTNPDTTKGSDKRRHDLPNSHHGLVLVQQKEQLAVEVPKPQTIEESMRQIVSVSLVSI